MLAGMYIGPETVEVRKTEKPEINDGEALLKVHHAGFCGSDLFVCSGEHPRAEKPLIIGHEFSGTIEDIKGSKKFSSGDKVVVRPTFFCEDCYACDEGHYHVCENLKLSGIDKDGGFAEYTKVDNDQLFKLPENMSFKEGALMEPLAVAVHSVRASSLKVGDEVVVLGSGPIGILVGVIADLAGADSVYISDINQYRLNMAQEFGLETFHSEETGPYYFVNEKTNGKMADVTFEAAGVEATAGLVNKLTKIKGEIVVVGVFDEDPETDLLNLNFREQKMIGTRVYTDRDFSAAIKLAGKIDNLEKLITEELDLQQLKEGIELVKSGKNNLKVMCEI